MEAALAVIIETAGTEGQTLRAAADRILGGHADAIGDS